MSVGILLIIALVVFGLTLVRNVDGPYAEKIDYGGLVIPFSVIDRACYAVALLSVIVALILSLLMLWGPKEQEVVGKILSSAGLLFGAALLILVLNRLMRGRQVR